MIKTDTKIAIVRETKITTVIAKEAETDTIRVHLHIVTEVGAATELTTNLKIKIIVKSIMTAWLTQLYFTNSKKRYQLLKIVFEDLQSGNYLRDKKKKTKDTSS